MKKTILLGLLLLALFLAISGCIQPCGNKTCEENENNSTCPQDCPKCDDGDKCTTDSFDYQSQKCQSVEIIPCCGNGTCQEGEDFFSCPQDCEYEIELKTVRQVIIPQEGIIAEERNSIEEISRRENDYLNEEYYIEIPFDHPTNPFNQTINAKDYTDLTFNIPSEVYNHINDKEIFFEMYAACGNTALMNIKSYNRFGGEDTIQELVCGENWEEKEISFKLEKPTSNEIRLSLKAGGITPGRFKIDYIRVYAKKIE